MSVSEYNKILDFCNDPRGYSVGDLAKIDKDILVWLDKVINKDSNRQRVPEDVYTKVTKALGKTPMGMVRVGRSTGKKDKVEYPGFTPIWVLTKSTSTKGFETLSPYLLMNDQGQLIENVWQFSKVYQRVPKSTQVKSQWDRTVIWQYPEEVHVDDDGRVLPAYFMWRNLGMNNPDPIRYPVGLKHRKNALYSLHVTDEGKYEKLDYVQARKKIYIPEYNRAAMVLPEFKELQRRLLKGENLLILEIDGPHQESLDYYKETYGVSDDFIEDKSVLVTEDNMRILLNDTKHPFGHGYVLASALLGLNLTS